MSRSRNTNTETFRYTTEDVANTLEGKGFERVSEESSRQILENDKGTVDVYERVEDIIILYSPHNDTEVLADYKIEENDYSPVVVNEVKLEDNRGLFSRLKPTIYQTETELDSERAYRITSSYPSYEASPEKFAEAVSRIEEELE